MVRNEKIARSNSGRPCLTRGIYGLTEPEYEEARPVPSRHTCWWKECNTPGVCQLLSTMFEHKHDKFNGNKEVKVSL